MRSSDKLLRACAWVLIFCSSFIPICIAWPQNAQAMSPSVAGQPLSAATQKFDDRYPGIGRSASPREVAAWDIDVRPDFKGLPSGSGSVEQGLDLWERHCSSCHGVFGESNQTFAPLAGGTTAEDVKRGRVARLTDPAFPGRTTLMKLATLSSLWDYINRAMPWNAPKSLTADEVYAVTAYLLNLGGIVPDDFTLSDRNIASVQRLLPNRDGMTTNHGLWPGKSIGNGGKPDVRALACMKQCTPVHGEVAALPDFARDSHGNPAEQNRLVGAQHGFDTAVPPGSSKPVAPRRLVGTAPTRTRLDDSPSAAVTANGPVRALVLVRQHSCLACHGVENRSVGPSFREIAEKYAGLTGSVAYLTSKIRAGGSGLWGSVPMPVQNLSETDAQQIAQWIAFGAAR